MLEDIAIEREIQGRESRAAYVAVWLRKAILSGALSPGDPIGQDDVAERLGVSRIPVREALRQLQSEGLIVNPLNRTARVALPNFAECEQIYKMRERLEPLALSESMPNMGGEPLDHAAGLAGRLPGLTSQPAVWLAEDQAFHLACYAGLQESRLADLIIGFWGATQSYRRLLLSTFRPIDFERQDAEHQLILEAISEGNARAGEEILRVHIERSRLRLTLHKEIFAAKGT
jgi:DNA-binding GntR family transcriptional regulator